MNPVNAFFYKYKVFIFGLLGAIITAIVTIDSTNGITWSDFIMPAVIAITGFIGTNIRGQWSSIVGIALVSIVNIVTSLVNHKPITFSPQDFQNLVLQLGLLYGFIAMPPTKPRAYEHDPVIEAAKDGDNIPTV